MWMYSKWLLHTKCNHLHKDQLKNWILQSNRHKTSLHRQTSNLAHHDRNPEFNPRQQWQSKCWEVQKSCNKWRHQQKQWIKTFLHQWSNLSHRNSQKVNLSSVVPKIENWETMGKIDWKIIEFVQITKKNWMDFFFWESNSSDEQNLQLESK